MFFILAASLWLPVFTPSPSVAAPSFQEIQNTYFGSFEAAIEWIEAYLIQILGAFMFTTLLAFWLKTSR